MSMLASRQKAATLSDLVASVASQGNLQPQIEGCQRRAPRYALYLPVWARPIGVDGPEPVRGLELVDISAFGLGAISKEWFEPGRHLLVQLNVNGTEWNGLMQVAHCTETLGGYKIGLKLVSGEAEGGPEADPEASGNDDSAEEPTKLGSLRETKQEVVRAKRAYARARRSWGLLGRSEKKGIRHVIRGLPEVPGEHLSRGKRRARRYRMSDHAHLVFPMPSGWKIIEARIIDVSETGVGLEIRWNWVRDFVQYELEGEAWVLKTELMVIVGIGAPPRTLWVPGQIAHCHCHDDGVIQTGVEFNTDVALETLSRDRVRAPIGRPGAS